MTIEGIVDLVKRAGEIIDSLKADCIVPSREKRPIEKQDELLDLLDELQDICEQIDFAMSLVSFHILFSCFFLIVLIEKLILI
jgi:hypothetical protein